MPARRRPAPEHRLVAGLAAAALAFFEAGTARAEPPREELLVVACAGFGFGAAGLVAGSVTGGLALAKSAELETACIDGVCPPARAGDVDDMAALGDAATATFVVAGVGLAAGVGALVAYELIRDDARAIVALGAGSATLAWRF
jgi:hypothetical protein